MGIIWIFITFLAVGIAMVIAQYVVDIRSAHRNIDELGGRLVEINSSPMEYLVRGDGYPLLMVHGAMGGIDQGLWLAHNLDGLNLKVICVSRFGYLGSPVPEGADLNRQADAYAGLLDALQIRRAAVFAASAGSTSAIRFAASHPERISALVLLCPDSPGKMQVSMPSRSVFNSIMRSDFIFWAMLKLIGRTLQTTTGLVPEGYKPNPDDQTLVDRIQWNDLPVSRRMDGMIFESFTVLDEMNQSITSSSPYPLADIQVPVLVIHAMDDPITTPENVTNLAEKLPNMRRFVVPDGGHLLFRHTSEVRSEIARFLHEHIPDLAAD